MRVHGNPEVRVKLTDVNYLDYRNIIFLYFDCITGNKDNSCFPNSCFPSQELETRIRKSLLTEGIYPRQSGTFGRN